LSSISNTLKNRWLADALSSSRDGIALSPAMSRSTGIRNIHPPFRDAGVPEIQDFNVLPAFRRRAIGTKLMDEAERLILERSFVIGIGVGLHHDYGAAQRLYVKRGYVPDALGITSHGRRVNWGEKAKIDDDLVLWFTKTVS
jgi:ribosomal protein S18 acetylase RimI-like enzyme